MMVYPTFTEIPDFNHSAPFVRNDLCEPQFHRGDLLMADMRLRGRPGGYVKAKAFGVDPEVLPFELAIKRGMRILAEIVGVYDYAAGEA